MSVVSLSVSPDDGSGPDEVPCGGDLTLLNIGQFLFGVVCVRVVVGFFPAGFPNLRFGFLLLVFPLGGGWPPSPKYSSMSGPSSFLFSLLSFLSSFCVVLSMMTVVACTASVVNDDSCGVLYLIHYLL